MKRIYKISEDKLKEIAYYPDLSSPTSYVQSVNEQLVEEMVKRENQMLKEIIEEQRIKQHSEFNKFLTEFEQMEPEEQNSAIYSFTDLLKRMHEIQNKEMEEAKNQWEKFKDEQRKND